VARQGYGNASFEVGGEEGLDIVEEFYSDQQNAAEVKTDSASVHQVMEDAAGRSQTGSNNIMSTIEYQYQVLNITAVIGITALSRSTIYALINPKSDYYDPTFPKKVVISQKRIGWLAIEIHQWIEDKANNRN